MSPAASSHQHRTQSRCVTAQAYHAAELRRLARVLADPNSAVTASLRLAAIAPSFVLERPVGEPLAAPRATQTFPTIRKNDHQEHPRSEQDMCCVFGVLGVT
jgi:hypothetical protein